MMHVFSYRHDLVSLKYQFDDYSSLNVYLFLS